ncbi:MAG TPA: hypothetical protein PK080_00340 [Hyphomonadaceae bacterium]|nr:hypothetical protein [Hyphomonadaceae bacterium]
MTADEWGHSVAAMDAALREAGRLRRLASAREDRARKKRMATPEWQAAHAARCAQWQVESRRQYVARLRSNLAGRTVGVRRLLKLLQDRRNRDSPLTATLLERIPDEWRQRRHLQRELRMVLADLAQLEATPEPHAEAVAVVEERKHTNG